MFCLHCKVDLPEGAKFCPECGRTMPVVPEVKEEIIVRSGMPEVMTLQQASKHFFGGSISYWKLLGMVHSGELAAMKVGGRILVRVRTLRQYAKAMEKRGVPKKSIDNGDDDQQLNLSAIGQN